MNAKDITTDEMKLKVLIYGKSGTGKTGWGCSFPKPYVFDFDNGMLGQRGKDIEYDVYSGPSAYQDLDLKLRMFESDCPFETLIFDSITTMQEARLNMLVQMSSRKTASQAEWGMLIIKLREFLDQVTKLDKNIVVITHEILVQDELIGEISYMPVIYGKKLPAQFPLFFDEVYRLIGGKDTDDKASYHFLTSAGTNYMAKSRLGYLDTSVCWSKDGKMVNAYELIKGEKK